MTSIGEPGKIIENWMLAVAERAGSDNFDDLHIDQIEAKWALRENWLGAGMDAYRLALGLRDQHQLPVTVALAFSLQSSPGQPRGVDFSNSAQLMAEFDWSPPSLYLFVRGREDWCRIDVLPSAYCSWAEPDAQTLFGPGVRGKAHYVEFRRTYEEGDEYLRTLFLAA